VTRENHPLLVVISGPSGVGKDALLERLKQRQHSWHFLVTATTRPKRPSEHDGAEYTFLDTRQFREMIAGDEFLEHAEVYGYLYGVPRTQINEAFQASKDVIVKTDVQGARTLKTKMPQAILIFLAPPSMAELERRLRERKTDTDADLKRRTATAWQEMKCQVEFNHVVVNHKGRLAETIEAIEKIIAQEKAKGA